MNPEIQLQSERGRYRYTIDGVAWSEDFWPTPEKALLEAAYHWANRPDRKKTERDEFFESEAHRVGQYGKAGLT